MTTTSEQCNVGVTTYTGCFRLRDMEVGSNTELLGILKVICNSTVITIKHEDFKCSQGPSSSFSKASLPFLPTPSLLPLLPLVPSLQRNHPSALPILTKCPICYAPIYEHTSCASNIIPFRIPFLCFIILINVVKQHYCAIALWNSLDVLL